MFSAINNSTEYMAILHIVVKLNVDFERSNVTVRIFHKQLLGLLDEDREARFSKRL